MGTDQEPRRHSRVLYYASFSERALFPEGDHTSIVRCRSRPKIEPSSPFPNEMFSFLPSTINKSSKYHHLKQQFQNTGSMSFRVSLCLLHNGSDHFKAWGDQRFRDNFSSRDPTLSVRLPLNILNFKVSTEPSTHTRNNELSKRGRLRGPKKGKGPVCLIEIIERSDRYSTTDRLPLLLDV